MGIISFFTSAYAAYKSRQIDKTLNKYKNQQKFIDEQPAILNKLQGFIDVINEGNMSEAFIPDVVCVISSIRIKYKSILEFKTRFKLSFLLRYIKKPYSKIKPYDLSLKISDLKGHLEKKED